MIDFARRFAKGLTYEAFLQTYATPEQQTRWNDVHRQCHLSDTQQLLLRSFVRETNVLCLAGAWCGDCARQCPILDHFGRACPTIHLRFIDRDADPELAAELRLCGGGRVPVVVLLSEDFCECARYGDRTLSRYRELAGELSGAACPTGLLAGPASLRAAVEDWLREFERVQWMLRLSPRLRQKHGD